MSRIRKIRIRNFRGIKQMEWSLPDKNVFCFVGRGDSTKSTILEALRRVFYPQWNLVFDDADFFQCTPDNEIEIDVVLGDIPDSFIDLNNYGQWLSGWNQEDQKHLEDPDDDIEVALRVRLHVSRDLEPSWSVIKRDDDDGIAFKGKDRAKVAVSLIGTLSDRHLTWARGSILSQLTTSENINASLAEAGRAAKSAVESCRDQDLKAFDEVAKKAEETARSLGVIVSSSYKAHLDADAVNIRLGGLTLHDGEMPVRQLGLGSKRMLATGLQKEALQTPHITLFDEVEAGLEPHRIARLVHHLRDDARGQYFLTTHSPVVLRELTVDDLHIVHCKEGRIEVVAANKPAIAASIQGNIRQGGEVFLAPKIIVCEGTTEVGFLRGLDRYWLSKKKNAFAYQGVALFDGKGAANIKGVSENLKELGYDVAVLADSDAPNEFSSADAKSLEEKNVAVTMWGGSVSIEERVFADLPWGGVQAAFNLAREMCGDNRSFLDQIQTQYGSGFNRNYSEWTDEQLLRTALGKAAKVSEWFKRQDKAQELVSKISTYLECKDIQGTDLICKIEELRRWIDDA